MFWFKTIRQVIAIFRSNQDPDEIGAGFALGSIIGLNPTNTLHNYVILLLLFLLNVNKGAALIGVTLFAMIGYFTDPYAHQIGYKLLVETPALNPFWTRMYNTPIIPFTRFNNTVVLGSLVIALVLFIPAWLISKKFLILYRRNLQEKVNKWKIIQLLQQAKWYEKYLKIKATFND
ncbi:MAG: TIGR03546 family protein [bacterium]|nr:TIGR03546 family protein [bacterium]MDD5354488.1 TIGR03546 family protein [bacterium]MDD5755871.1 TIGR03546 family protein [bacterium]